MSVDLHYFADRIAKLEENAEAIKADIKDEYAVAASKGFNARALRKAIKIRRMDAKKRADHDAEQSDLILYLEELERSPERAAA